MGTKLECAVPVNPLASSQQDSNISCSFSVHFVDDYFRIRAVKESCQKNTITIRLDRQFQISMSMDRAHTMESIRKTMQMHEDIFKHQVRELHRLYSVQRMLMDEMKKEFKQNRIWITPITVSDINLNFHVQGDPSGSCSADTIRINAARGFDLERDDISAEACAVQEDQAQAAGPPPSTLRIINQMSTGGSASDEDSEVELTLSIGGSSSSTKKMANNSNSHSHSQEFGCTQQNAVSVRRELDSSASFKSEKGEDCSGPNTPMSSSSATFDQETKRPHWLFQGLSINRT